MEACCCPSLVELHFPMVFIENELQAGRFLIVLVSPEELCDPYPVQCQEEAKFLV
jgi:hypothetical protein